MNQNELPEAAAMFHSLVVAYQIALRDILGSGRAVFVCPVLENFAKVNEATGVHMSGGQNLDIALQNLSKTFKASGFVKDFRFEKLGVEKYIVHIDGCICAPEAHKKLNTKDFACPLALMSMSLVQAYSGNRVEVTDSDYFMQGTKTRIETIEPKKTA